VSATVQGSDVPEREISAMPMATCVSLRCTSAAFAELSADLLRAGVALRFRAQGVSMAPLVRDGDVLLVRPAAPRSVRIGDVVLCSTEPGRVVAHRVVRKQIVRHDYGLTVQGDALSRPDASIPGAQLYGRVAALERAGAQIDLDRPVMMLLGRLAALRSRWNLGRGARFRRPKYLLKRLPGLSKYLA